MNQPGISFTAPIVSQDCAIWFSAYGFGWGYCAFALPSEAACQRLGAANETPKQLLLAFELGKRGLLHAIERKANHADGKRIDLAVDDFERD